MMRIWENFGITEIDGGFNVESEGGERVSFSERKYGGDLCLKMRRLN